MYSVSKGNIAVVASSNDHRLNDTDNEKQLIPLPISSALRFKVCYLIN